MSDMTYTYTKEPKVTLSSSSRCDYPNFSAEQLKTMLTALYGGTEINSEFRQEVLSTLYAYRAMGSLEEIPRMNYIRAAGAAMLLEPLYNKFKMSICLADDGNPGIDIVIMDSSSNQLLESLFVSLRTPEYIKHTIHRAESYISLYLSAEGSIERLERCISEDALLEDEE